MASSWLIFDKIRAFTKQNRIHQAEKVFQDQSALDRLVSGGEFLDFNSQAAILDQTNLQINRLERYKDYEQMDQTGEVALALDLYADEASLVDPERKHTLVIRARNRRLKSELEHFLFNTLLWDTQCRPAIRYLCKYGDLPCEIVPTVNRDGVSSLRFMNVYNFTRIETKFGDLVGFFYQDEATPEPVFMHPWQVMHLRLTSFENLFHPYGRSILDGGRKAFKQLRLMEDSALIYRITRAPEKRKFTIPVGKIPPHEVAEYMQMIARDFKRQRFYNPTTGTFDERYSPLIQEDDFFLPRRDDGVGPDITTLPGAENLDQIADIEYFKKKMIAPMKIPFERVGIGKDAGQSSEKSLSMSHSEFAKSVQWIQREVASGITKVAIVHLALKGYTVEDLRGFDITLSATSAMEELYRIETWQTRASVMNELKELGWFPKEWIVTRFTDLSPDEIEELKDMEETESQGGGGGGIPGGLDDGMDLEGEDGELPLPDENGGDAEIDEAPIEGFDYDENEKLIKELDRQDRREKSVAIMENWSNKLKKDNSLPTDEYNNGFDYLIESKEIDGLTRSQEYSDNDDNTLVEWSVPKKDRDDVVNEVRSVVSTNESKLKDDSDDEITDNDIPK